MSSIGLMDGAFFVGRKEIVDWINSTLQLNLDKIEETAPGTIACQLLDIMHPNCVPMHKVNWSANKDFEYVANYKILQTCFNKLKIEKFVDVDRLIKGKYQDNLEFMQWFKRFFEMTVTDLGDYDAVAQRSKGKGGAEFGVNKKASKVSAPPRAAARTTVTKKPVASSTTKTATSTRPITTATATKTTTTTTSRPTTTGTSRTTSTTASRVAKPAATAAPAVSSEEVTALKQSNEALTKQCAEMKLEMDGLVTERDFYFDKLRDVEMILQELEDSGKGNALTASIFKILYETAEGFEAQEKTEDAVEGKAVEGEGEEVATISESPATVDATVEEEASAVEEEPTAAEVPSEASAPEEETF